MSIRCGCSDIIGTQNRFKMEVTVLFSKGKCLLRSKHLLSEVGILSSFKENKCSFLTIEINCQRTRFISISDLFVEKYLVIAWDVMLFRELRKYV